jgi:hypothetical protein
MLALIYLLLLQLFDMPISCCNWQLAMHNFWQQECTENGNKNAQRLSK